MVRAGAARSELAEALNSAYGAGLLSDRTLSYRLEVLFSRRLIEPIRLVGDLSVRSRGRGSLAGVRRLVAGAAAALAPPGRTVGAPLAPLLALDWTGAQEELVIGRDPSCDVVLGGPFVSRRHALLSFRDGGWMIRDLDSKNGTALNGTRVGRSTLHPGDLLAVGIHLLRVD